MSKVTTVRPIEFGRDNATDASARTKPVVGHGYVAKNDKEFPNHIKFAALQLENVHLNRNKDGKVVSARDTYRVSGGFNFTAQLADGTTMDVFYPNGAALVFTRPL